jgi:flavodoxin
MAKVTIIVGSMYGNAENLAIKVQETLNAQGIDSTVAMSASLNDITSAQNLLFITSTTGQGDLPDNIQPVFSQMQSQFPMLTGKTVGVIGLGDTSYGDTYCGGGKQVQALIEELNATIPVPMLEVDACEYFDPWEVAEAWLVEWVKNLN